MRHRIIVGSLFALLCAGCAPVISRTPLKTTPEDAFACAGGLLGSMGYELLERDDAVRAERAKHAAFGQLRADYERVTVAVIDDRLHVRGETVAVGGASRATGMRGSVDRGAGGPVITWPSRELRADVARIATECGG